MKLLRWLLYLLERPRPDRRRYSFDGTLLQSLQSLAEQERRSAEELAADLLNAALARRQTAEGNLLTWEKLSFRQQQVTALTCLGYTNRQIAARLVLSPETVKTHLRNVLRKFDLPTKAELRRALADWDFGDWD